MNPFRIAISGSRAIDDQRAIYGILDAEIGIYLALGFEPFLHLGDAHGVDWHALCWARERSIPRKLFFAHHSGHAEWVKAQPLRSWPPEMEPAELITGYPITGRPEFLLRNAALIGGTGKWHEKADLLIAIWDGISRGTRHAMATARNQRVFIHQWGGGAKIVFATVLPIDDELVEWKSAPASGWKLSTASEGRGNRMI